MNPDIFPRDECPICGNQMTKPVNCTDNDVAVMTSRCKNKTHYGFDLYQDTGKIYYVSYAPSQYSLYIDFNSDQLLISVPRYGKILQTFKATDIECQTFDQLVSKIETYINFS